MTTTKLSIAMAELGKVFTETISLDAMSAENFTLRADPSQGQLDARALALERAAKKSRKASAPSSVPVLIDEFINDVTEGVYLTKDYLKGKASSVLRNAGGVEDGSETAKYLRIIYDNKLDVNLGKTKYYATNQSAETNSVSLVKTNLDEAVHINKIPELPLPFQTPGLGIFLVNNPQVSPAVNVSDAVVLFANSIPAIEMSRCIPYVRLTVTSRDNTSSFGMSRFLGSDTDSLDKIGLKNAEYTLDGSGEFDEVLTPGVSALDVLQAGLSSIGESRSSAQSAGMELFTSPQTLVNAVDPTRQGRLDKFRPFMSLQSVRLSIFKYTRKGGMAQVRAVVSITVHDRGRLHELEPLIDISQLNTTLINLVYGWSHPDGSVASTNAYGKFLDSMKISMGMAVERPDVSIMQDGQVSLDLTLITRGHATGSSTSVISGKFLKSNAVGAEISRFVQKVDDIGVIGDAKGRTRFPRLLRSAEEKVDDGGNPAAICDRTIIEATMKAAADSSGTNQNLQVAVEDAHEIVKQQLDPSQVQQDGVTIQKLFAAKVSALQPDVVSTGTSPNHDLFFDAGGIKASTINALNNKTGEQHVSLGKFLTSFLAYPIASSGVSAEVQVFFYPFNAHALKMADMSIAHFPLPYSKLKKLLEKVYEKNPNTSCLEYCAIVLKEMVNTQYAPAYGLIDSYDEMDPPKDGETQKTQAPVDAVAKNTTKKIDEIYASRSGKETKFTVPDVQIIIETMKAKNPNNGRRLNHTNVTRILISDGLTDAYQGATTTLSSLETGNTVSLTPFGGTPPQVGGNLDPESMISPTDEKVVAACEKQDIIRTESFASPSGEVKKRIIPNAVSSASRVKSLISAFVPTLRFGAEGSALISATVSATTDETINNIFISDALGINDSDDGTQQGASNNLEGATVKPGELKIQMLGCPLVRYGQQFFIDLKTNTNLDNVYGVTRITHTFTPGNFTTELSCKPMGRFDMKPVRGKYEVADSALAKKKKSLES